MTWVQVKSSERAAALVVAAGAAGVEGEGVRSSWAQAIGTTALIAGAGAMFYFMIKAMARIQMPDRPGAERRGRLSGD